LEYRFMRQDVASAAGFAATAGLAEQELAAAATGSKKVDPYWNHVARTFLFYSCPLLLLAFCLQRNWIGGSREFWVPLLFVLLALWLASGWFPGQPLAYKDYQNRDCFILVFAIFPAALWNVWIHLVYSPPIAVAGFIATALACDALMLRYELLCVYAFPPKAGKPSVAAALTGFSLPFWTYTGLGLWLVHVVGRDGFPAIVLTVLALALPVWGTWLYWYRTKARPQRMAGIRRVAVIGGGWAGIYAVKSLRVDGRDRRRLEVTP
jgi:hypothetical protein